jgi:branched-chain amino acid transport system permease protein
LGTFNGAALLTTISQVLAPLFEFRFFLYGGILLVTLTLMPDGLMGALERRLRLLLKRRDEAAIQAGKVEALGIESILATQDWNNPKGEILEIRNLTRSFGGLTAVNDVDLKIHKGHIHAIIGPNGAGKTTLINLVAGGLAQSRSFLWIYRQWLDHSAKSASGITAPSDSRLFGDLSVLDNILLGFYCQFSGRA